MDSRALKLNVYQQYQQWKADIVDDEEDDIMLEIRKAARWRSVATLQKIFFKAPHYYRRFLRDTSINLDIRLRLGCDVIPETLNDNHELWYDLIDKSKFSKLMDLREHIVRRAYQKLGSNYDHDGTTLLFALMRVQDIAAVKILLDCAGIDLTATDKYKQNILHVCCSIKNGELTQLIISKITREITAKLALEKSAITGETPLDISYNNQDEQLLAYMDSCLMQAESPFLKDKNSSPYPAEAQQPNLLPIRDRNFIKHIPFYEQRNWQLSFQAVFSTKDPAELLWIAIQHTAPKLARKIIDNERLTLKFQSETGENIIERLPSLGQEWHYVATILKIKQGKSTQWFSNWFGNDLAIDEKMDPNGNTMLHKVSSHCRDSVQAILKASTESVDKENNERCTPFMLAVKKSAANQKTNNPAREIAADLLATKKVRMGKDRLLLLTPNELTEVLSLILEQSTIDDYYLNILVDIFKLKNGADLYQVFISNDKLSEQVRTQLNERMNKILPALNKSLEELAQTNLSGYLEDKEFPNFEEAKHQLFHLRLLPDEQQTALWQQAFSVWLFKGFQQKTITNITQFFPEQLPERDLFLACLPETGQEAAPLPVEKILLAQPNKSAVIPGSTITPFLLAFAVENLTVIESLFRQVIEADILFKMKITRQDRNFSAPTLDDVLDKLLGVSNLYRDLAKSHRSIQQIFQVILAGFHVEASTAEFPSLYMLCDSKNGTDNSRLLAFYLDHAPRELFYISYSYLRGSTHEIICSTLFLALCKNHPKRALWLLDKYPDIHTKDKSLVKDSDGKNALHYALLSGDDELVKKIMPTNSWQEIIDDQECSEALFKHAVRNKNQELMRLICNDRKIFFNAKQGEAISSAHSDNGLFLWTITETQELEICREIIIDFYTTLIKASPGFEHFSLNFHEFKQKYFTHVHGSTAIDATKDIYTALVTELQLQSPYSHRSTYSDVKERPRSSLLGNVNDPLTEKACERRLKEHLAVENEPEAIKSPAYLRSQYLVPS